MINKPFIRTLNEVACIIDTLDGEGKLYDDILEIVSSNYDYHLRPDIPEKLPLLISEIMGDEE